MSKIDDGLLQYIDSLELSNIKLSDKEINKVHQMTIRKIGKKQIIKPNFSWRLASGLVAACLIIIVCISPLIFRPCNAPNLCNLPTACTSIEDAEKLLGYKIPIPSQLPSDYQRSSISVIDQKLLSIDYTNNNEILIYRTAQVNDDISGDYNDYESVKTIAINEVSVLLKGNGERLYVAIWQSNGCSFSITSSAGMIENEIVNMVKSIYSEKSE